LRETEPNADVWASIAEAGRRGIEIAAASAASRNVGAIEIWLQHDDLNIQRDVYLLIAAAPAF
jgi:hypothetical protein